MFGYVRPCVAEMKVKEHTCYRAVYCGLCKASGGGCLKAGAGAKLSLRYDTVFLALIRMMVEEEGKKTGFSRRRCLLHPIRSRVMADKSDAITYSAGAATLLFAHSLRDHAKDTRGIKKAGVSTLLPYANRILRRADRYGCVYPSKAVRQCLARLDALEEEKSPSPDQTAEVFGDLLCAVFAHNLPNEIAEKVGQVGFHLGRWIYLADAADDMEKDKKSGSYNPFLCAEENPDRERIYRTLLMILRQASDALALIEGGDRGCRSILENILTVGLVDISEKIVFGEKEKKQSDERINYDERSV